MNAFFYRLLKNLQLSKDFYYISNNHKSLNHEELELLELALLTIQVLITNLLQYLTFHHIKEIENKHN